MEVLGAALVLGGVLLGALVIVRRRWRTSPPSRARSARWQAAEPERRARVSRALRDANLLDDPADAQLAVDAIDNAEMWRREVLHPAVVAAEIVALGLVAAGGWLITGNSWVELVWIGPVVLITTVVLVTFVHARERRRDVLQMRETYSLVAARLDEEQRPGDPGVHALERT